MMVYRAAATPPKRPLPWRCRVGLHAAPVVVGYVYGAHCQFGDRYVCLTCGHEWTEWD